MNFILKCIITSISKTFKNGSGREQQFLFIKEAETNELLSLTAFDDQLSQIANFQLHHELVQFEVKLTGSYSAGKYINYLNVVKIIPIQVES